MSDTTETSGQPGPVGFARMAGSSIAGRDAAPWVTDFLNAAYYRRPVEERDVDDLRLAFSVLTTYWYRKDPTRRLRVTDLPAFHRAFGGERFGTRSRAARSTATQLLSAAPPRCSATGSPTPTPTTRGAAGASRSRRPRTATAYDPEQRLKLAKVGQLTPESAPLEEQVWHTYPPVEMPSAEARHRRADAARDVAGLRERDRPLHAAARRAGSRVRRSRSRSPPARDSGRPRVHARLRDDHHARHAGRPGRAARRGSTALEDGLARTATTSRARVPEGARAGRRLRPHDPPRPLHGQRPQPPAALHARGPGVGARRRHVGPDAVAPRPAYRSAGSEAQHAFWGAGRRSSG